MRFASSQLAAAALAAALAFGCGGSDGPTTPGGGGGGGGGNNPPPLSATVQATVNSTFNPAAVTIARTGTVTWAFAALQHNVTFGTAAGAPADIGNSANTSVARTFSTAGTFNYTCTLHPGMNGSVTVQ